MFQRADNSKKRFRASLAAALFTVLGGLIIITHPDNPWHWGLGAVMIGLGVVVALYEMRME